MFCRRCRIDNLAVRFLLCWHDVTDTVAAVVTVAVVIRLLRWAIREHVVILLCVVLLLLLLVSSCACCCVRGCVCVCDNKLDKDETRGVDVTSGVLARRDQDVGARVKNESTDG